MIPFGTCNKRSKWFILHLIAICAVVTVFIRLFFHQHISRNVGYEWTGESEIFSSRQLATPDLYSDDPHSNSSHRWEKIFHDIFDVPDPLSTRIGPDNVTFKDKYVIYRCDNDTMANCGGWADRVRAMMTTYLIANLSGRVFKAEIIMPECDIQRFMIPNHVNWSLPVSFHNTVIPSKKVKILNMWAQPAFYYNFTKTDWVHHPGMDSDFFYMKGNHDNMDNFRESTFHATALQWMQGQDRVALNKFLFKRLFRPTDYLRQKVVTFLTEHVRIEDKLLCIHLRMGQNPTIPLETRGSYNMDDLPNVWNVVRRKLLPRLGRHTKIFLMSDSTEAIARALRQPFAHRIFIAGGEIIHIELTRNISDKQKCDGFEKVLFEKLVLLHCDGLILSDSGISRMSAYVRGLDENRYCFLRSGAVKRCRLASMKNAMFQTRS